MNAQPYSVEEARYAKIQLEVTTVPVELDSRAKIVKQVCVIISVLSYDA